MDNLIFFSIQRDDLKELVRETFKEELEIYKVKETADRLLSPEEACKVFNPAITKMTLRKWSADGLIPFKKLGSRVFYRHGDLISAGKSLKKYKR